MKTSIRIAAAALIAVPATALVATAASAAPPAGRASTSAGPDRGFQNSVFVQTDNPAGNTVVAYHRADDGTLHQAGTYATGGLGGVLTGSVVDHLASQGSLSYDTAHRMLYAVNAGSNTITSFQVRGDNLSHPQVYPVSGSFPVSIATRGDLVYVLTARDGGAVQGFLRTAHGLVPIGHRTLGLDPQAAPEFTHTPGQITFTPDGRHLVVTTKANTNAVDVIPLDSRGAIVSTTVAGSVPFASTFDRYGHLLTVEAGPNALASGTLDRTGHVTPIDEATTGQMATCWITGDGSVYFVSNAGSGTVTGYRVDARGHLMELGSTATDPGTVDATESGSYLYVQTGATGTVDGYRIGRDGSLTRVGSTTVPGAVGGEGIAAS